MAINIAIDGPAGAGKSSTAKLVAKKLGYIYVDTGALYRTVGLYSIRNGIDTKDAEKVIATLPDIKVELKFVDGAQHVFLNGEDVSEDIRTPEASMGASNVSAIPKVREFLFDLQRSIAAENNCIMDGRDIGTVVLPNADVKIFLTTSVRRERTDVIRKCLKKAKKRIITIFWKISKSVTIRTATERLLRSSRRMMRFMSITAAITLKTAQKIFSELSKSI